MPWSIRSLLAGVALLAAGCASSPPRDAVEWSTVFQRASGFGWSGGDAASTVPLPGGRVLWLFGDSYLSAVEEGVRTHVELRYGNTIAIERNVVAGQPPTRDDLAFDWAAAGTNGWLPLDPDVLIDPAAPPSGARARDDHLGVLSWPLHGAVIGSDLVLFHAVVTSSGCDPCTEVPFKVHGSVASIVAGVDRPYSDWGFRSGVGWEPGRAPTSRFVPWSRAAEGLDDVHGTLWGTYVLRDPDDAATLYVYGNRHAPDASDLVVARVAGVEAAADVLDFARWQFWDGRDWAPDADSATRVAASAAVEGSVVPVPGAYGGGYALVQSGDPRSGDVRVSLAADPWGPFTDRYTLHLADCPVKGFEPGPRQFTYAAKAHPELGTPDELLISFVTEHTPPVDAPIVASADQYAPRFVHLPWDEVLSHGASSKARCGAPDSPLAL